MSKSDEIRRMRERQFAQREGAIPETIHDAPPVIPTGPADAEATEGRGGGAPAPRRAATSRGAAEEQGRCPGCGKIRAVVNGLMASHQKGLGKVCPGSRQAPA